MSPVSLKNLLSMAQLATSEQFEQWQKQLNEVGPIIPLINPGQSVVATKNLTHVDYSPVWYIDFAAIGSN